MIRKWCNYLLGVWPLIIHCHPWNWRKLTLIFGILNFFCIHVQKRWEPFVVHDVLRDKRDFDIYVPELRYQTEGRYCYIAMNVDSHTNTWFNSSTDPTSQFGFSSTIRIKGPIWFLLTKCNLTASLPYFCRVSSPGMLRWPTSWPRWRCIHHNRALSPTYLYPDSSPSDHLWWCRTRCCAIWTRRFQRWVGRDFRCPSGSPVLCKLNARQKMLFASCTC